MRLFNRPLIAAALLAFVVAALAVIGGALYFGVFSPHPQFALDTFNEVYATSGTRIDTCTVCHTSRRSLNPYGKHQKSELSKMANPGLEDFRTVLRGLDELDSDNDGYTNMAEIKARTFPGDPADHPSTDQR